jgi:hypothetical protein
VDDVDDGGECAANLRATSLTRPGSRDLGRVGSGIEGIGRVGDVVPILVVLADADSAGIGPEMPLMIENGEVSEIEKEAIEEDGFRTFVFSNRRQPQCRAPANRTDRKSGARACAVRNKPGPPSGRRARNC